MGTLRETRFRIHGSGAQTRLNSWKEIAAYLDRDPRTVQLWEKTEGLPVHRLNHQARASVYAFTGEIDAWLNARSFAASPRPQTSEGAPKPVPISAAPAIPIVRRHYLSGRLIGIAALLIASVAICIGFIIHRYAASQSSIPVLAVLPFQNQTSTDESLVDGLTDGLIADLDRVQNFKVISRHSVSSFENRQVPLSQIASRLHATLLVEGTVAQAGNQTQVTVELVDARNQAHLWGATYTRQTGDIQALEDEVTSQIAAGVTRRITGADPQVAFPSSAVDPRARQAYLEGRYYWNQRDLPGFQKAISSFGQAIAIDPRYAAAYSGLAESYVLMTDRGVISNDEAFRRARAAAATALSLDPSSAGAYNALAMAVYRQDWDFVSAEQYFQKAIQLDPSYAVAHQWYGEFLGDLRRFDSSIAELKKAKELDPLSPMVSCDLADGYMHAGQLAEADAELNRVLELYPEFHSAHDYRLTLAVEQGKFDEARDEAALVARQTGNDSVIQSVEIRRLAAQGNQAAARTLLAGILADPRKASAMSPYTLAGLYFATGQNDAAYNNLEKAYRDHSWWLVTMLVDPGLESARTQTRFLEIARRVGLPSSTLNQALL